MLKLGVNIDHVATLRQARGGFGPDPLHAARICEKAGAHSIVMHLREDRRHVQDKDLFRVKEGITIRLNMEMSIAPSVVKVAAKLRPHQITLVPEKRRERTTESGLDLIANEQKLRRVIGEFKKKAVLVSLFVDPDPKQVEKAMELGADAVEFHTGTYANVSERRKMAHELHRLKKSVVLARELSLTAHAGHGLDYRNVRAIAKIKGLEELNIGYSIITQSLWVGLEKAVRQMRRLI